MKIACNILMTRALLIIFTGLTSCIDGGKSASMNMAYISFECYCPLVNDSMIHLQPIRMNIDVEIANNTDKDFSIGSYNQRFDPKNKKYGSFKLINNRDTTILYSGNTAQYTLKPNETMDFQLYYEGKELFGDDKLLKELAVNWNEANSSGISREASIRFLQQTLNNLQLIYVPDNISEEHEIVIGTSEFSVNYLDDNAKEWLVMHKDSSDWSRNL